MCVLGVGGGGGSIWSIEQVLISGKNYLNLYIMLAINLFSTTEKIHFVWDTETFNVYSTSKEQKHNKLIEAGLTLQNKAVACLFLVIFTDKNYLILYEEISYKAIVPKVIFGAFFKF